MLRVLVLAMLCAGFLQTSHAARNLRRPTQSVQTQLSVDESHMQQKQASTSVLMQVQARMVNFFYPRFLQKLVSAKMVRGTQNPPPAQESGGGGAAAGGSSGSATTRWLVQFAFGLVYYFLIVRKYPELGDKQPNQAAKDLQDQNEVMALMEVSPRNCILAFCCTGPRAAHTFSITGTLNYWAGLCLMTCVPCCTLCAVNSFCATNEKLGGEKRNIIMSCLCALCCSCCVVAQDAEALDLVSGVQTGLFGVYDPDEKKGTEEAKEAPAEAAQS